MEEKKICPDCGSELTAWEHKGMISPYYVYEVWKCTGKCREAYSKRENMRPEQIPHGIHKLSFYKGINADIEIR